MNEIHLVMLRYTMDNSPLDDGGEYAEQVRFAFADRGNAELMADELDGAYGGLDSTYFVATHSVVSKQQ